MWLNITWNEQSSERKHYIAIALFGLGRTYTKPIGFQFDFIWMKQQSNKHHCIAPAFQMPVLLFSSLYHSPTSFPLHACVCVCVHACTCLMVAQFNMGENDAAICVKKAIVIIVSIIDLTAESNWYWVSIFTISTKNSNEIRLPILIDDQFILLTQINRYSSSSSAQPLAIFSVLLNYLFISVIRVSIWKWVN